MSHRYNFPGSSPQESIRIALGKTQNKTNNKQTKKIPHYLTGQLHYFALKKKS